MAYSFRNGFVNPYLGTRRMSGIWPPSNPGCLPPPERANNPLCPLVAVFPCPDPGPRPIRFRFFLAPFAGARSCKFMMAALPEDIPLDESIREPEACQAGLPIAEFSANPTRAKRADVVGVFRSDSASR